MQLRIIHVMLQRWWACTRQKSLQLAWSRFKLSLASLGVFKFGTKRAIAYCVGYASQIQTDNKPVPNNIACQHSQVTQGLALGDQNSCATHHDVIITTGDCEHGRILAVQHHEPQYSRHNGVKAVYADRSGWCNSHGYSRYFPDRWVGVMSQIDPKAKRHCACTPRTSHSTHLTIRADARWEGH